MKRRDWKIKNSKKDIFGNIILSRKIAEPKKRKKRKKYLSKNIYFLRKLFLRRNRVMKKKNFIMNFLIYRKLKNSFFFKLNRHINNNMLKSLSRFNYVEVLPIFFLTKKVFINSNIFNNFIRANDLNYLFAKNYNNMLSKNNLRVFVFNKKIIENNQKNLSELFLKNSSEFIAVPKSNFLESSITSDLDFFLNYHLYILNSTEIYKIITILYIFKIYYENENINN